MMKYLIFFCLLLFGRVCIAQEITIDDPVSNDPNQVIDTTQIYASVTQEPLFGNTYTSWDNDYVKTNMKYPEKAKQNGAQGKVIITFVVERDGHLTDIKLLRSFDTDCGKEAIRLVQNSPRWKPAMIAGKAVRCQMTKFIKFQL